MENFIKDFYLITPLIVFSIIFFPINFYMFFEDMSLNRKIVRAICLVFLSPFAVFAYVSVIAMIISRIFPDIAYVFMERGIWRGVFLAFAIAIVSYGIIQLFRISFDISKGKASFVFMMFLSLFIMLDTGAVQWVGAFFIQMTIVLYSYYILKKEFAVILKHAKDKELNEINKIQYSIISLQLILCIIWNAVPDYIAPLKEASTFSVVFAFLGYGLYLHHVLVYKAAFKNILHKRKLDEEILKNEKLQLIAKHDDLTGILNRRGFYENSEKLIKNQENQNSYAVLMYADIDNLKTINDIYGHKEGDKAIKAVSKILFNSFRNEDVIGRIGGDEFAVLALIEESGSDIVIKKRLKENTEIINKQLGKVYKVEISIGIYEFKCNDNINIDLILEKADEILYEERYRNKKNYKQDNYLA